MRARKAKKQPEIPADRFWRKLSAEHGKRHGMVVKAERMPQGSMEYYRVRYIPASQLEIGQLELYLRSLWGEGSCFLRFVDEKRQPLDQYGGIWVHLGYYDDLDDRLEEAQAEVTIALLEAQNEQNENQLEKTIATCQALVNLTPTRGNAFNKLAPAMQDALRRSMQRERPDSIEAMHETMKLISEVREQEHQRIMKQQADAAKQFLDSMPPEVQAALQAQGLECQTPEEPAGRQFTPENCSQPIVGLQRLKIRGEDNQ